MAVLAKELLAADALVLFDPGFVAETAELGLAFRTSEHLHLGCSLAQLDGAVAFATAFHVVQFGVCDAQLRASLLQFLGQLVGNESFELKESDWVFAVVGHAAESKPTVC